TCRGKSTGITTALKSSPGGWFLPSCDRPGHARLGFWPFFDANCASRFSARDQREATGEVVARTAVEPHLRAGLAGNDGEAVVLDLMEGLAARWQLIGFGWEARRDEPSSGWENLVARDQARPAGTPLVAR